MGTTTPPPMDHTTWEELLNYVTGLYYAHRELAKRLINDLTVEQPLMDPLYLELTTQWAHLQAGLSENDR